MKVLVDANVLLRSFDTGHPMHKDAVGATDELLIRGHGLQFVPQIIYESWAVLTRPTSANGLGKTAAEASALIGQIGASFVLLDDSPRIYPKWLSLVTTTPVLGKKAHDARLVAAMHVHGIDHILTFNDADFRRFAGITVLTPAGVLGTP